MALNSNIEIHKYKKGIYNFKIIKTLNSNIEIHKQLAKKTTPI